MPNNVKNRLIIKGEKTRVAECIKSLEAEKSRVNEFNGETETWITYMDFETIVPQPKSLADAVADGLADDAIYYFAEKYRRHNGGLRLSTISDNSSIYEKIEKELARMDDKRREKSLANMWLCAKNVIDYGYATWYDWNRANWGTKWNAYDTEVSGDDTIIFCTAWSCVAGLIKKLSAMWPDLTFEYTYADEDTGYNCGRYEFEKGEEKHSFIPEGGSNDAYEIAFELRPDYREYYEFVDGEYHYKEEED